MKRVLKIAGIVIGFVLILLIIIPLLFKSRIESMVKETVNREIAASVDWERFSLTFFRGFPDLSVNLHDASVVGAGDFEGDTLAALERFEVRVNPFGAIRKSLEVKSIILDRPLINGIVAEEGRVNWDIFPQAEEEPTVEPEEDEEGDFDMGISLKRFAIQKGRIYYRDHSGGIDASMEGFDLELSGDFTVDQTDLNLETSVRSISARAGGVRYLRDAVLEVSLLAGANLDDQVYTLKENRILLNGLMLGSEGEVRMLDEGAMDLDLRFYSGETSFKTLLSLVPAIYLSEFESVETSGTMLLEGSVKGMMTDSIFPDARLSLQVNGGSFSYPGLPGEVSEVEISLLVDYRGTDMDATTLDLERFHLLLGGNPFEMRMQVTDPVSDMRVAGRAAGVIDFSSLQEVVPLDETTISGRLNADIDWDTRLSYIEQERYEEVNLNGLLAMEGFTLQTASLPVPVQIRTLRLDFSPRIVELTGLDLLLGSSDLRMTGELTNFIPYMFSDRTISGTLTASSDLLDINEWMSESESSPQIEEDSLALPPPDSAAEPVRWKIPENVEFGMELDLGRVEYEEILVENIRGRMEVSSGVAELQRLGMEVIGGSVQASGTVDTRGEFAGVNMDLEIAGVDIPSAYSTFVTVKRLAPMARYCRGTANVSMEYRSLLDAEFTPLYGTIDGNGRIFTRGLQIYNTRSFVRLSELMNNEKFRQMAPDEVDIRFRVEDGRVQVDPFEIDFDDSKIVVSGSHGIDQTLDYLLDMSIARGDLGSGAQELMQGMEALAAGAGISLSGSDEIKVKARIRGTFSDPRVTTDLTGNLGATRETVRETVRDTIEQIVTEKAEEAEEEIREEAGREAEKLIADAEREKKRLVEEARAAGENLVREAEAQGEKLVREAGSNPIRQVAARRAAEELKEQAQTQSDRLIEEAEQKGDALIEQAREQAGNL